MASEFWGINRGQREVDVVVATSTSATDIELRVDLTKSITKEEVMRQVEQILNIVLKGNWPPA